MGLTRFILKFQFSMACSSILRYLANDSSSVDFQFLNCSRLFFGLYVAPKEISRGVISHNLGSQFIAPTCKINCSQNCSYNKAFVLWTIWQVVPSCWKHMLSKSQVSISDSK